uniref:Uncharacterized protein n=1 Tax=Populus trichocarpa TaxID=3694 RepID=A0A3N7EZD2_POPTR
MLTHKTFKIWGSIKVNQLLFSSSSTFTGVFRGIYQSQTSDVILETNQHLKNSDSIIQKF